MLSDASFRVHSYAILAILIVVACLTAAGPGSEIAFGANSSQVKPAKTIRGGRALVFEPRHLDADRLGRATLVHDGKRKGLSPQVVRRALRNKGKLTAKLPTQMDSGSGRPQEPVDRAQAQADRQATRLVDQRRQHPRQHPHPPPPRTAEGLRSAARRPHRQRAGLGHELAGRPRRDRADRRQVAAGGLQLVDDRAAEQLLAVEPLRPPADRGGRAEHASPAGAHRHALLGRARPGTTSPPIRPSSPSTPPRSPSATAPAESSGRRPPRDRILRPRLLRDLERALPRLLLRRRRQSGPLRETGQGSLERRPGREPPGEAT